MALKVSRILHAGYLFEAGGVQIAFDPLFENPFSVNCHAFPAVEFDLEGVRDLSLSAVFISHVHDDHCSLESLTLLKRDTPIFIFAPDDELPSLIRAIGFERVSRLQLDHSVSIGPFDITPLEALDADVDSIFHIKVQELNILNVVDSWIGLATMDRLALVSSWDLILWPFQTMREIEVLSPSRATSPSRDLPPEWIEQLQTLKPRFIVPSSCQFQFESWSWLNRAFFPISYRTFEIEMKTALPECEVIRMNPSVAIELARGGFKSATPLPWIRTIGTPDVDYEMDKTSLAPSTAEIARNFPALTVEENERVLRFCRWEILTTDADDGAPDVFWKPKGLWRLSIYDHEGEPTHFHYTWENGAMEMAPNDAGALAWTTDLPASKLYGALERGESLTSMYVRINDAVFSQEAEANIAQADVLSDPLLCALFSESTASYQRAQFKRLAMDPLDRREP